MKVTLNIPDWAEDEYLKIISNNMELVAYKTHGKDSPWIIKDERCNRCIECCLSVGPEFPWYDEKTEKCKYLRKNAGSYVCDAGPMRPVKCTDDPPFGKYPSCSITYRKLDE